MKKLILFICFIFICSSCYGGVSLNGDNDCIDLGNDSSINFTDGKLSIFAVVKLNSGAANAYRVFTKYNGVSQRCFIFSVNTDATVGWFISDEGEADWTNDNKATIGTISLDEWEKIGVIVNGSSVTIFLNGTTETFTTSASTIYSSTTENFVGAIRQSNDLIYQFMDGSVSHLVAWSTNISVEEMNNVINSNIKGIEKQIQPSEIVLQLYLDDYADGIALNTSTDGYRDSSSSGNNGTGIDADGDSTNIAEEVLSYPGN